MKLNIQDAAQELPLVIALVVISGLTLQNGPKDDEQTRADATTKPKSSPTAEQAANNTYSGGRKNSMSGKSRWRRIIAALVLIGIAFSAYAIFCFTFLLPSYGKDFYEELETSFTARTDVPLFYVAFFFFIGTATRILEWRQVTRFESRVFQSPLGHAALWVACAVLQLNASPILTITFYPFFEDTRGIDHRVLCYLHLAYKHSLLGKIVFWALVGMVGLGYLVIQWAFVVIKIVSAGHVMTFIFSTIRQPCRQYLFGPLGRHVLDPLYTRAVRPLAGFILPPIGTALYRLILIPLGRIFPGPSTKTEHAFCERTEQGILSLFVPISVFIGITSAVMFTASEEDKNIWQQKSRTDFWLHVVIFYSMAIWFTWHAASALNFAPAVRLERVVYMSRIGWTVQSLVFFPWLYSLWRMVRFSWILCIRQEGAVYRFLDGAGKVGSFTIAGWGFRPIGLILDVCFKGGTVAGFHSIIVSLGFAMVVCFKKGAHFMRSYQGRLYSPAASKPSPNSSPALEEKC